MPNLTGGLRGLLLRRWHEGETIITLYDGDDKKQRMRAARGRRFVEWK